MERQGSSHEGWTVHRALQRLLPQNTTLRDTLFAAPVTEGHVSQWHGLAIFQWAVSRQRNHAQSYDWLMLCYGHRKDGQATTDLRNSVSQIFDDLCKHSKPSLTSEVR